MANNINTTPAGIPGIPDISNFNLSYDPNLRLNGLDIKSLYGSGFDPQNGNDNSVGYPKPSLKKMSQIKEKLLRPATTSHFQAWFGPPIEVQNWLKARNFIYENKNNAELISLSCSEASLPGSSLNTNEINDDYTGVTERFAYRKLYDDRANFTFYVDHNDLTTNNYNIIWFFENWIAYIANEQYANGLDNPNYNYRFRFPNGNGEPGQGYRSDIYLNKFEKDYKGGYLEYRFLEAYPISIISMPVSYDSSQLLKCDVSFTYTRYTINRLSAPDIKQQNQQQNGLFNLDYSNISQSMIDYSKAFGSQSKLPSTSSYDYKANLEPYHINLNGIGRKEIIGDFYGLGNRPPSPSGALSSSTASETA